MTRAAELIEAADRAWGAAWALDARLGGTAATQWLVSLAHLWFDVSDVDPKAVAAAATALEQRIGVEVGGATQEMPT